MGIFRQFPYTNFHEFNLDEIIKIMRQMQDEWEETKTEWASYKDFIDNYFANLNLDEETEKALRRLLNDGSLDPVIDPVIATETAAWLADHITQPSTPAVDTSLTVAGAAADAKVTGEAITDIYAVDTQIMSDRFPVFTAADFEAGALSQSGETGSPYTIRTKHFYNIKNANIKFTGVLETGRYCYPYFYDDNFTWVSRFTGDWTTGYDVPNNATYLRFVYGFTSASGQTVEDYGFNNLVNDFSVEMVNNTIEDIYDNIDYIQTGIVNNPVTDIPGKYIAYADGTLISNSNYHATDYVEISEFTNLIETNCLNSIPGTDGYAFYDSDKIFISSGKCQNSGITKIKVPATAKYVRLCSRYSYEPADMVIYVKSLGYIQKKENKDYTVVMLGDSIIGNYNGANSVPAFLEDFSGAKCFNCAFGGSNMGTDTQAPVQALLLPFRGFKVIEAIVNNNYTDMDTAIADDPDFDVLLDYYPDHVNKLKTMDWSKVDIITLSYGTNDWGTAVTVADNALNPKDTDTFGGALRTALESLWSVYPHIKVMICGVIWRGGTISGGTISWSADSHTNAIGAYLKEYEEKAEEVASEYHVPFVKMYDFTNINEFTWTNYFPISGSNATHPNENGRYVIAKRYAQHLAEL